MSLGAATRPRALAGSIPRLAIAHDYLTQKGGAERIVLAMHRAFPEAPIYTSVYEPDRTFPEFQDADVRTLPLDRLKFLRRHHRLALPFLAPAFSSLKIKADVLICSSSGWAHGTRAEGRKLVYCYTPARWLYQTDRYMLRHPQLMRIAFRIFRPLLVWWDRQAARSADGYLTHSTIVQERIRSLYGIDAEILPGPHALSSTSGLRPVEGIERGYFLCVSRLLPYKNVDAILAAFVQLPTERLIVVGNGPERARLASQAPANARLVGSVSDAQLAWLYTNCRAVVAASYEDYGLTPLEAAAFGKPSVVLRWGGFLDTVIENETGVFFDQPTPQAIRAAVAGVNGQFTPDRIREHAAKFSEERFIERLREIVAREARHA